MMCGLTAGSSCVIDSYVCACANILSCSVELVMRLLMCFLCLKFKINAGSVVDCDWLDQVGCYGDRSEPARFK